MRSAKWLTRQVYNDVDLSSESNSTSPTIHSQTSRKQCCNQCRCKPSRRHSLERYRGNNTLSSASAAALNAHRAAIITLVDQRSLGKPPVFSGRVEDIHVWAKKVENHVAGVYPYARAALHCAVESHEEGGSETITLKVRELDGPTSAEIDAQLFVVLRALTEGASFDIVTSSGGERGDESWAWIAQELGSIHGRTSTHSLERHPVTFTRKVARTAGCHPQDGRSRETPVHQTRWPRPPTSNRGRHHLQLNRMRLTRRNDNQLRVPRTCTWTMSKDSPHPGADELLETGAFGIGNAKQGQQGLGQRVSQSQARTAKQRTRARNTCPLLDGPLEKTQE